MRGFPPAVSLLSLFLLSLSLLLAPVSHAQTSWGNVFAETSCNGFSVVIQVEMTVGGEPPPELVGWAVDREVVGACVAPQQVGELHEFEAGTNTYILEDLPEIPDRKTIYYVRAVDAQGGRHWISWPQRTHFTQADCVGGPAARGTVVEVSLGYYRLEVCPDSCWWAMSMFDEHLPSEAPALVGQIINVYGEIVMGMEGPFIGVIGWDYPPDGCEAIVPADDSSWSVLKARYSGQ